MGIHYDYKSTRGEKAMKKEAKRKLWKYEDLPLYNWCEEYTYGNLPHSTDQLLSVIYSTYKDPFSTVNSILAGQLSHEKGVDFLGCLNLHKNKSNRSFNHGQQGLFRQGNVASVPEEQRLVGH